ncbi:hypothetical protein NHX12_027498 [Muraenolepis orangiensis]|uniref:phospholipase A2 n=1 Tax=Muraenolepis orangiensis TaxID=630683 RepID=A0A9Q0ECE8_9TELE|nr:hypothetical protein NHX12_027498 [Muraenolepis orangiensis]
MRFSRFRIFPVILIFLTFQSSFADAADVDPLCARTQLTPSGDTHYSFVHPGPSSSHTPATARLYHSVWSGGDRSALLSCSWVDDAVVVAHYLSLCREEATKTNENDFSTENPGRKDALLSAATRGLCGNAVNTPGTDRERATTAPKRHSLRVKRGFIVPGTLWCGSGNKALSYADLGVYMKTDSCCREHDQCQDTILSFQSKFGVFNRNIFTMSHCDCDNRFRICLENANDSISDVVGYTFFNLLKMNCFELSYKVECRERNWFGMCKATQTVLGADVQSPTAYEPAAYASEENATLSTPPPSFMPPSYPPSMTSDLTSAYTTTPASNSGLDGSNLSTDEPSVLNGRPANTSKAISPQNTLDVLKSLFEVYRELDQCRARIRPQQRRYGLLNADSRTMYHCSCTDRCQAILHRQPLSHQETTIPDGDVDDWRHLVAVKLQVRRPDSYRVKRKHAAIRLRRLCERLTRAKVHQTMSLRSEGTEVDSS